MQGGIAEERIEEEMLGAVVNDMNASIPGNELQAANESNGETTEMTQPDDLETPAEAPKPKKRVAKRPGRPGISAISQKGKPAMAAKKKKNGTNGDTKASLAVDESTKKLVRRLRAQMEMEDGNRVSFAEAITFAVNQSLK